VLAASVITLIPVFILMFRHVLNFYNDPEHQVLPLSEVLGEQLPFVAGMVIALVAGILYSGIHGVIAPRRETPTDNLMPRKIGSRWEKFWWSYMRISGILIVPLIFGHLAMMHVIQGVFDITAQGATVVGTNLVNESGTSVEFVADRWNMLIGGVAIWRLYDIALLALVVIHGFNGLRYVLTDYTSGSTLLRRGMIYTCIIGALVLLVVGALALLGTIDQTAIQMAEEAAANLNP
jgi:succinate dehydrogenase / fumarate reductase membrane anchor subunit